MNFKNLLTILFAGALIISCKPAVEQQTIEVADETVVNDNNDIVTDEDTGITDSASVYKQDSLDDDYWHKDNFDTAYVIITDTSENYHQLRKKLFVITDALKLKVDTLGRYFDKEKNMIILPDDADDEMYAGDYLPRRFGDDFSSIEYYSLYANDDRSSELMCVVTGIYYDETKANSALAKVKSVVDDAFILKTQMYMGCLY